MTPAIFLDRDGTILEDRGLVTCPADVAFLPGAVEALQHLKQRFRLFLIVNESAMARRTLTRKQVDLINGYVLSELYRDGICVEELYACPGAKGACCNCHRPGPQFLIRAAQRYGLDLSQSWTVGDHPHDAELGRLAGGRGIVVMTGHGAQHRAQVPQGIPVAFDLSEAARLMFAGLEDVTV